MTPSSDTNSHAHTLLMLVLLLGYRAFANIPGQEMVDAPPGRPASGHTGNYRLYCSPARVVRPPLPMSYRGLDRPVHAGDESPERAEELAHIADQEVGDFHSWEVPAPLKL